MTRKKAIELLNDYLTKGYQMTSEDLHGAMELGVEALKQIGQIRVYAKKLYLPLLPGETKT